MTNSKRTVFLWCRKISPSRMRVLKRHGSSQVVRHMGMCQPLRATQYPTECFKWAHAGTSMRVLLLVLSSLIGLLVTCAMALHIPGASVTFTHSFEVVGHSTTTLEHSSVMWGIAQGHSCSVPNSGIVPSLRVVYKHCKPNSAAPVLVNFSSPGFCKLVHPLNLAMRRERLRMSSRRGGSRGRATAQRTGPISPSSSIEVTSEQHRLHGITAGRGRGPGSGSITECGHEAHPTVRYRIPCTLANSTFIVSVTVEHCDNLRGQAEVNQENPPPAQGTMPTIDLQRPAMESSTPATQAGLAGPSEPAQGVPTCSMVPLSDSDDSRQFGCRVEEEPYTTDDD